MTPGEDNLQESFLRGTVDPKSKAKESVLPLGMVLGFSDELLKIAVATYGVETSTRATGTSQVIKAAPKTNKTAKLPKLVSKPQTPPESAPIQDHISSMKANPPPPITM